MTGAQFDATFQAILFEWAGVSDVDPTSSGPNVNAQHLAFLYSFYGIDPTTEPAFAVDPNSHSGSIWESDFQTIVDQMEVRFASQIGFSLFMQGSDSDSLAANPLSVFSEISYDVTTDTLSANLDHLLTSIVAGAPSDPSAAESYYDLTFRVVRGLRVDLFNDDNALFTSSVLSELGALGVSAANETTALNAFGFVDDERSATGQVSLTSVNEVVLLGTGDKILSGGAGNGYVYSADGGNDTVSDNGSIDSGAEVVLDGLNESGVVFERPNDGSDLLIVNSETGSTLTLPDYFENSTFQTIEFDDGPPLAHSDVATTLRNEAKNYLLSAAATTDTLAQQQGTLSLFGFTSTLDEGTQTGTLDGTFGADVIFLGSGDKTVAGGGGADLYVYSADGGDVVIDDTGNNGVLQSDLIMNGIASTDVSITRPSNGNDLAITINSTGKTLTIQGEFAHDGPLNTIAFSDGVTWSFDQVQQMLLDQESATPGETIFGFAGRADTLVAGLGDRLLNGEGGADTYVYSSAGGNDIVVGESQGTLQFTDIASTDVTLSQPNGGTDLVLTVTSTGESVTVQGEYTNGGGLAAITFSDGVSWSFDQVQQMLLDQESATPGATIYGFAGRADTLVAGVGDRLLNGEGGADTYVYSSAGGNDIVVGESGATLEFSDIASTDVTLSRPNGGTDLVLTVTSTGESVSVQGEYTNGGGLAAITFSDGVSWSFDQVQQMLLDQESATPGATIYGFAGRADTLVAGVGDRLLNGEGGADTYVYSSAGGNDIVVGESQGTLQFTDIASTDVTLSQPNGGTDLVLTVTSTGESVTVQGEYTNGGGLAAITFSDGVSWSFDQVQQMLLDQESATPGATIYGFAGRADTLVAGVGDRLLNGEGGADTYVYSSAGGNDIVVGETGGTLEFSDISSADVTLSRPNGGSDLDLTVTSTGESVTVQGEYSNGGALTAISFSDGVTWNFDQIEQMLLDQESATAGAAIYGFVGRADTLVAGVGDRLLNGEGGADTYVYSSDGGNDIVVGETGATLEFSDIASTDVTLSQPNGGGDLVLTVTNTGESVTVQGEFSNGGALAAITFSDGVSWNQAQIEDILNSGSGSANVFQYAKGGGNVTVNLNGVIDTINFGAGITAQDVYFQYGSGGDLVIQFVGDDTDSIVVNQPLTQNSWGLSSAVSELTFADGTSMVVGEPAPGEGAPLTFTWYGTASATNLVGGNDVSNIFVAGPGGDTIDFGNESNTIGYNEGDGDVTINNSSNGTGTINFGSGITAQDVYFEYGNQGDLVIQFVGDDTDRIVVNQPLTQNSWGLTSAVTELTFADGTSMSVGQQAPGEGTPLMFTWYGTSSATTLVGGNDVSNLFVAGPGGDTIDFGDESNSLDYDEGDGKVTVNNNDNGTGTINFGSGITAQDVYFQYGSQGALVIQFAGDDTDSIDVNVLTVNPWGLSSAVTELTFADGTSMTVGQPAPGEGTPLTFTWYGTASDTNLVGGNDVSNIFVAGPGGDTIDFGDESNTIDYDEGDGNVTVNNNYNGAGTINFGSGITAQDVYFQYGSPGALVIQFVGDDTDSIVINDDLTLNSWGLSSSVNEMTFANGTTMAIGQPAAGEGALLTFTWYGRANSNTVGGNDVSNSFILGAGSESFNGGNGNNTYTASATTGQATINANAATGMTNELDFTGSITDENLWFAQSGNDLKIDLLGTNTQVDVSGWFNSSSNQLQEITAGGLKIDSQISQLVQAMATYSANNSGFDPASSGSSMPNNANVQSAIAAAWHP
jgi:hypothetical protein